jgi:hypothetical protein
MNGRKVGTSGGWARVGGIGALMNTVGAGVGGAAVNVGPIAFGSGVSLEAIGVSMIPRSSPPGVAVMRVGVTFNVGWGMALAVARSSAMCVPDSVEVAVGEGLGVAVVVLWRTAKAALSDEPSTNRVRSMSARAYRMA